MTRSYFQPPKHILPSPGYPPIPPSWCLRSKGCLSLPFTRSLQLCGSILNTPGLFESLPSPPLLSPLTALSTSQPATTFVSYQREMGTRRERAHVLAHLARAEPNLPCTLSSLLFCVYIPLDWPCLCSWITPRFALWLIQRFLRPS